MSGTGHVIEVQPATQTIRVEIDGEVVAESSDAVALEETGAPTRWYLPRADVRSELLRDSDHHSHCPFKGDASYHHVATAAGEHANVVWYYPEPLEAVEPIRDRLAFHNERAANFVGGAPEE